MIESGTPAGKKSVFTKQLEENFSIEHLFFILTVLSDIQIAVRTRSVHWTTRTSSQEKITKLRGEESRAAKKRYERARGLLTAGPSS